METRYEKWFSPALGRDMEIKSYGHAGRPVLFIPCQNGRFFDFDALSSQLTQREGSADQFRSQIMKLR